MRRVIIISLLLLLLVVISACSKITVTNNGLDLYHEKLYFFLDSLAEEIDCEDPRNQDLCVLKEAIENENISQCEQLLSDLFKFDCYTKIAELKQDFSICDQHDITPDERSNFAGMHIQRFLCYENVIIAKGNLQLCKETFEEKEGQNACYRDFAGVTADVTICDTKIDEPEDKTFCYIYVAEASGDISLCDDKIEDEYYKQGCYTNVALATEDKSICDEMVTLEEFKRDCEITFSTT
tara:strand:+ start:1610 stop:2323 length:714 start_codon:yes stop_codon:yes gene_type:complete